MLVFRGTLKEARERLPKLKLRPGRYVMTVDLSRLPGWALPIVKGFFETKVRLESILARNVERWEWRDAKLVVYYREPGGLSPIPIAAWIVIILLAVAVVLMFADKVLVEVRRIAPKVPKAAWYAGALLAAGLGLYLAARAVRG